MPLRDQTDFGTFGWSVACAGRTPDRVRTDVRTMVDWAEDTVQTYFPAQRGYKMEASSPAGVSNGVQLRVWRGDFQASVSVESILDPTRKTPNQRAVRMFGRAQSGALTGAESDAHRVVRRSRTVGHAVGAALLVSLCWAAIGVPDPVFVLGGLVMLVTGLFSVFASGTLGAWVGERLAAKVREKAATEVKRDPGIETDLRRWRSLTRRLSTGRRAITGRCAAPFRALPAEVPERENSRPMPRAIFGEALANS